MNLFGREWWPFIGQRGGTGGGLGRRSMSFSGKGECRGR
jgi:hypothetical protein